MTNGENFLMTKTISWKIRKRKLTWKRLCWYDSLRWPNQVQTEKNFVPQPAVAQNTFDTYHSRRLESAPVLVHRPGIAAKGGHSQRCSAHVVPDEDLWIWGSGNDLIWNRTFVVLLSLNDLILMMMSALNSVCCGDGFPKLITFCIRFPLTLLFFGDIL